MIFGPALTVLMTMAIVMLAAWAFGLSRKNGGWTDVFWTIGSGITLAAAALWPIRPNAEPDARQWLVAALVAAWAARLGGYLVPRVAAHPEDPRYAAFRRAWGAHYARNMLWVSLPQAPATGFLALSVLIAAQAGGPLGWRDAAGVLVFLVGVGGEALADVQMKRFKADPANRGKVCDVGLWGWSRHPNYFFEWLVWLAYPAIGFDPGRPLTWLSFAAPVVMFVLLTRVSGIPPLEESQLKSKGEAYAAYQRRVSAFLPLPPHRA
jgi:steroid 5-alpha reductase family enzyme